MGMADHRAFKKSSDAHFKKVTDKVILFNKDVVEILLCVHVCLGDEEKVVAWMKTKNLNFGGIAPIKLINTGRAKPVLLFVQDAAMGHENLGL